MSAPATDQSRNTQAPAWTAERLSNPHAAPDKADRVRAMFNAIAPSYERVNRFATFGMDASWRSATVRMAAPQPGEIVVDLCCGTGDMLRTFAAHQPQLARLVGVDFAREMLDRGDYRHVPQAVELIEADATQTTLPDAAADVVSCAFGVRNFQSLQAGLSEMRRLLRPGGRAVILEFATPQNPVLRFGYNTYCNVVLPRLGRWIGRDRSGAYDYLPRSIQTFETRASMTRRLSDAGFDAVTSRGLNFGGVVIYRADVS